MGYTMRTIFEETDLVSGSGGMGGKGGGDKPTEATTLTVKEYVRVFAVLSEGPIHGVPAGKTYNNIIFLNNTPLVNPTSGESNFKGYKLVANLGTPGQPNINPMRALSFPVPVGVRLIFGSPTLKTIERADANVIRIVLSTQRFSSVDDKGNISGVEVPFLFEISSNGGPYVPIVQGTTGVVKSDSYIWSYDYLLTPFGSGPYTIRISRLSPNSVSDRLANDLIVARIDEFVPIASNYEGLACAYAAFAAENFGNSIPLLSSLQEGIVLSVPHNYLPLTRSYTGIFSGALVPASTICDNPAWVIYRLLTSTVYGRGIPSSKLDVFSFYELARYCDGLVSDGKGGLEPRYRFNCYLNQQGNAEDVLNSILATCRARMYDSNGALAIVFDKPVDFISYVLNPATVVEGSFQFQTSPVTTCYTTVSITWFDPTQNYEPRTVTVTDPIFKAKFGNNVTKITAMGCTSRGQAIRLARWTIYSACLQRKLMSVKLGPECYWLAPGNRVKAVSNRLVSGRLKGNNLLDRSISLTVGSVIAYDKVDGTVGQLTVTVATTNSDITTGMVGGAPNGGFVVSDPTSQSDWIILGIEDTTITCIQYDSGKFSQIETFSQTNLSIPIYNFPRLTPPVNLSATESLYVDRSNTVLVRLNLVWGQPSVIEGLAAYEVSYKRPGDSSYTTTLTQGTSLNLDNLEPDSYEIRVRSMSRNGPAKSSNYNTIRSIVVGLKTPPSNVTNLVIDSYTNNDVRLSWNKATDLDVIQSGRIEVRLGSVWQTATPVNLFIAGSATTAILPIYDGTYSLKTVDSSGNYSSSSVSVTSQFVDTNKSRTYATQQWGGPFAAWDDVGTILDNVVVSGGNLSLITTGVFNTKGNFNASGIFNSSSPAQPGVVVGTWKSPRYTIDPTAPSEMNFNLATVWTSTLASNSFNKKGIINSSGIFNGQMSGGTVTQELEASIDGVNYMPFQLWASGKIKIKYWGYRITLKRTDVNQSVVANRFKSTISMDSRGEAGNVFTSSTSDIVVPFSNGFFYIPSLTATIVGGALGEYFSLTSVTFESFTCSVRDSLGNRVARTISWNANGFGKIS